MPRHPTRRLAPGEKCPKCGKEHKRCTAHNRRGTPCNQPPVTDHWVCRNHGGRSPVLQAKLARQRQEREAAKIMHIYGAPRDVSPIDALLEEIRWTAGHVAWLRQQVQGVDRDKLTVGVAEQVIDPEGGKTVKIKSVPNVWLDLYDRERKHLVAVCSAALKAGIDERQVRIAERQGEMITVVLERIFEDLQLSKTQQARIPEIVPRHLRAIAGGKSE